MFVLVMWETQLQCSPRDIKRNTVPRQNKTGDRNQYSRLSGQRLENSVIYDVYDVVTCVQGGW